MDTMGYGSSDFLSSVNFDDGIPDVMEVGGGAIFHRSASRKTNNKYTQRLRHATGTCFFLASLGQGKASLFRKKHIFCEASEFCCFWNICNFSSPGFQKCVSSGP